MLKVIGAGYSRTGTKSLQRALQSLGIGRCYHFTEVLKRRHTNDWLAILDGCAPDWECLFEGYAATVDWPAVSYYRELAERYPEAKVILTVRDPDAWHKSLTQALMPLRAALPEWLPYASRIAELTDRTIWQATFDGRANDRDFAVATFNQHIDAVRRSIDAERLLVFDVKEGWEPLCQFLELPVPDTPFPRTNSRFSVQTAVWAIRALSWLLIAAIAALSAAAFLLVRPLI